MLNNLNIFVFVTEAFNRNMLLFILLNVLEFQLGNGNDAEQEISCVTDEDCRFVRYCKEKDCYCEAETKFCHLGKGLPVDSGKFKIQIGMD